MPFYESIFICRPDVTPAQVETLTSDFTNVLKAQGGTVKSTEQWGLRRLAYRINKNRKGHYVLMNVDAPSAALQEMERTMRLNEDVMRYLSVKVDELSNEPSAVLRKRDRAEEGEAA